MREKLEALKSAYANASPILRIQMGKPAADLLSLLEDLVNQLEEFKCQEKKSAK